MEFWVQCGKITPELQKIALALSGLVTSASASERNWAEYKWIRTKKRNPLITSTMEKLTNVHTQLVMNEKLMQPWRGQLMSWQESDGITASNKAIENSSAIKIKSFTNRFEDWETTALLTKNNESYAKLLAKYQYVCFEDILDDGTVEIRRITEIVWRKSERRGEVAAYNARTYLVNSREFVDREDYIVNNMLHELIKKCSSPHNENITMLE